MCLISVSLHLLCNLLQLLFSAFITASSSLLLEYVKPDNSFCYQLLVEVCTFLMFSMFMCIMYFCYICIYIKNILNIEQKDHSQTKTTNYLSVKSVLLFSKSIQQVFFIIKRVAWLRGSEFLFGIQSFLQEVKRKTEN